MINTGICKLQELEPLVHGRGRKVDSLDETYLGVHEKLLYARKTKPVEGVLLICSIVFIFSSFNWCLRASWLVNFPPILVIRNLQIDNCILFFEL